MAIAVGAHGHWRRLGALDATEPLVLTRLSLARQHAIAHAVPTAVTFANAALTNSFAGRFSLSTNLVDSLRNGIAFVSVAETNQLDELMLASADDILDERVLVGDVLALSRSVLWCRPESESSRSGPVVPLDEPLHVVFLPDGSCQTFFTPDDSDVLSLFLDLNDAARTNLLQRRTLSVNPVTGVARFLTREEQEDLP